MMMVEQIYKKIFEHWESGNISTAYELTLKYMIEKPSSVKVQIIQADLLTNLYRFKEARNILDKLSESVNPKQLYHVYLQLGHFFAKKSNLMKSASWFKQAHLVNPKDPNPLSYIAHNYLAKGEFEKAKKCLKQIIGLDDGLVDEALFNLGLIEKSLGNYCKAIDYFDKALALDPDYKEAIRNKKDSLLALREL